MQAVVTDIYNSKKHISGLLPEANDLNP